MSVNPVIDIPGQPSFSVADCLFTQTDKDGNVLEYSISVKANNNSFSNSTNKDLASMLSAVPLGTKLLITGNYYPELRNRETKEIAEDSYILAHTIAGVKAQTNFNHIYLSGRCAMMPKQLQFTSSSKVETGITIKDNNKSYLYNIEAWNGAGNIINRYVRKGECFGIEGSLDINQWEDKTTGEPRKMLKTKANKIILMQTKNADQDDNF